MADDLPDLLKTQLHLLGWRGSVEAHDDHWVVRTPENPGYYHGNFLLLPQPPASLAPWLARFEEAFGPEVRHRCLTWVGEQHLAELEEEARALGLTPDSGVGLALDAPPAMPPAPWDDWTVRTQDVATAWPAIEALNQACDPAEASGGETYRAFKRAIRQAIHAWLRDGKAVWWGGFRGEELVAQCGFLTVGDLGRFQAVETHPDHRGQGACSALIAHVVRDGFERLGCRRILLHADAVGPAIGLYERLGFQPERAFHSVVKPSDDLQVLPEAPGQIPDVRHLNRVAFDGPGEAQLVDRLRGQPDVHSFVAVQSGAVVGQVLFSPVTVSGPEGTWSAMALGPMAVRPERQRQGIGLQMMAVGLEACRQAGHDVCFVLGHPAYYPKAGFVPAPPLGLTCKWPVPDEVFLVKELEPGALRGRTGRVDYDAAFDAV